MHVPVLLKETVGVLDPKPGEFFIDGTVGGGGHAAAILKKIAPSGRLLALDWDRESLERTKRKVEAGLGNRNLKPEIYWICGNYVDLPAILKKMKLPRADGLLLDLGFSSEQLEISGRGFSFMKDEPLLMRYANEGLTAAEAVSGLNARELADIFRKFGGERYAGRIARRIVEERKKEKITTTLRLAEIVKKTVPRNYERGRIHPATRVFQALRIYVNDELGNLQKVLIGLPEILKPGGRAAVISFHSLEDRIVKNAFKSMAKDGILKILTKKPMTPSENEIKLNPRSRSAKMRAVVMN